MKKIIFPALIIILSGLAFSVYSKANKKQIGLETGEQLQDSGSFSGSMKDLMGFGKTQKCTWTVEQGEGIAYIAGEKTRSEISILAMEGQPAQQMIAITDPEWSYSWNPVTKKGMKVKVEEVGSKVRDTDDYKSEKVEADVDYQAMTDDDYEFKCESWKANSKMFFPPTDVEFTDMNTMMEQNVEGMKKICDMLSGEDKVECLAGFEE